MPDWYPSRITDLVPWHSNFTIQAAASGTTHGLIAAQVTQIGVDAGIVQTMVNLDQQINDFAQAWTQYRDILLRGTINSVVPAFPNPPVAPGAVVGTQTAIEGRTRQYANLIKASVGYTQEIGELFGIVPVGAAPTATPKVTGKPEAGSMVNLRTIKAGYAALAIDSRRGGGAWEQIGVAIKATLRDSRPPMVVGQPEQREYRAQGIVDNERSGPLSDVVSVVTVP